MKLIHCYPITMYFVFCILYFVYSQIGCSVFNKKKRKRIQLKFPIINFIILQLPDNEDNIPIKDPEGCASSLFEIDASHERNQESSPFAASCSLKYEMESVSFDFHIDGDLRR